MRISNGRLLFSATDLMRFMGCAHATKLNLDHLQGRAPVPRADTADEPLIEDLDALGGLQALGPLGPVKCSVLRSCSYPPQETKLRPGKSPVIPAPEGLATAKVEPLDRAARRITLKVGALKAALLTARLALHPE